MSGIKEFLRNAFRSAGLEVRKLEHANIEETVIPSLLRLVNPIALLDVGANVGQFASKVRRLGYAGAIVSFEALPEAHKQLVNATQGDAQWIVAPCAALGATSGQVEINIASNSVSSSLLPMLAAHLEAAPESRFVDRCGTRLARLDDLAASLVPTEGPLYLKVDTQGYEREVIRGAAGLLGRMRAVQLELSLMPLYDGAPSFIEMVMQMGDLGYEIFSMVPGFRDARTGRLLQLDCFFIRG